MIRGLHLVGLFSCLLVLSINYACVYGQLSPGDLNEAHASLEGLQNCGQCHEAGQQVSGAKCLDCHKIIAQKLSVKQGFHGLNNYSDCVACHVEHLGRDSELIFWPDKKEDFDHKLAGYVLDGKHAALKCHQCHQAANIKDGRLPPEQYKDLNRTFLGLDQACLNCHIDEHRGQLSEQCLSCHSYDNFKPATAFDHDGKTDFPLVGKHEQAPCIKCHPIQVDNKFPDDSEYSRFTGIKHDSCSDCHEDIHRGKFSTNCQDCHNPADWKIINQANFDHSRTNFPLKGRHSGLLCEKCHFPGTPVAGQKHEKCTDCHQDYHRGQFAGGKIGSECSECHLVNGFTPALFSIGQHRETNFPLAGSHLAVPCIACHKSTTLADGSVTTQFKYESTRCRTCHRDPHVGEADKYIQSGGCEYCHNVESWRSVSFDHNQTKFVLEGKHETAQCRHCHKPVKADISQHSINFMGLKTACENCHRDIHQGQFGAAADTDAEKPVTNCGRCHNSQNWFPGRFDHSRAAFKLEGAHRNVSCVKCHKKIMKGEQEFTWFKPISRSCEYCHGGKYSKDDLGGS